MDHNNLPIICTLSSQEKALRGQQIELELAGGAVEVKDLSDGVLLRFPGDEISVVKLAQFTAFERECCRFLTIELLFEPDMGPVWLSIKGRPEALPFIKDMAAHMQ